MSTQPPPPGHNVTDGECLCGAEIPDSEAHAHYYHVSCSTFRVCPKDSAPVVTDFSVPGCEWRCPECGSFYPFLGGCPSTPSTHDLAVRYVAALAANRGV